jgi:endonuclease/exonuclease/phosphatase (EEP) superfamily protein YafD
MKWLDRPAVQKGISAFLVAGAVLILLPPEWFYLKLLSQHAFQVMVVYMVLGFLFLGLNQNRLLFVSFLCCGMISLFLKVYSDVQLDPPKENPAQAVFVFTHFNTAEAAENPLEAAYLLIDNDADLIAVRQVTPEWDSLLDRHLGWKYSYQKRFPAEDWYGVSVYSRYPLLEIDTFLFENTLNVVGKVQLPGNNFTHFMSVQTYPMVNKQNYLRIKRHFDLLRKQASLLQGPLFILGGLNTVPWSGELRGFTDDLNLRNGREVFRPAPGFWLDDMLEIPKSHILFSNGLRCLRFEIIRSAHSRSLGVTGAFQFREPKNPEQFEKEAQ